MGQMKNFSDLYEKTTSVIQRRKMGRRMARLQKLSSFQFKKKKAALKMRSPAKLHQIARKKLIQKYRDKFYPQYKEMSVQQRVVVDQKIMQKFGKKIDILSKRLAKKLKGEESKRIQIARQRLKSK
tara:strand:- start:1016 stop:1393 length:378 start_codon:yes stop_codon:yes gene_type:complete